MNTDFINDYRYWAKELWRQKVLVLAAVLVGLAGGLLVVQVTDPVYSAGTLIMVEAQKIPSEYVRPTVTAGMQERLKTLEQQITNRDNLEQIISELNLYSDLRLKATREEVIHQARRDLTLRVQGDSIFRVAFRGSDAEAVANVANRIADLFITENLRLREERAANTTEFLNEELEETRLQLEEQESRVAAFRVENNGQLPEQLQSNVATLSQLQRELQITLDSIEQAELRKLLLGEDRRAGVPVATQETVSTLESQLQKLRLELVGLRSKYSDQHPDVLRVEAQISGLEKEALARPTRNKVSPPPQEQIVHQAEMAKIDAESTRLEKERLRILSDINRVKYRLEMTSQVKQGLVSLNRDYRNLEQSYQSLLNKRIDARLAENLERKQQSEQFRILERAVPPSKPIAPNKKLYLAAGLLMGTVIGTGLALLRMQLDSTFDTPDALRMAFPAVPVLTSLPRVRARDLEDPNSEGGPIRRSA